MLARIATLERGMGCQSPHRDQSPLSRVGFATRSQKPPADHLAGGFSLFQLDFVSARSARPHKHAMLRRMPWLSDRLGRLGLCESGVEPVHHA